MKRFIISFATAFFLLFGHAALNGDLAIQPAYAGDCVAKNNLSEKAQSFISRCRKGSIKSKFPGEFLSKTLGEIKKGSTSKHKTAWKLLNDNRFKK